MCVPYGTEATVYGSQIGKHPLDRETFLSEPEIPLWCFNMYRWNNFEQLGATLVISGIFIGCLRFYGALIG